MNIEFVEELKRQWMAMIDAIDDPLVIIDKNYYILRTNWAFARNSIRAGASSIRDFRGKRCYEIFVGRDTPCEHCRVRDAASGTINEQWVSRELFNDREYEIRAHVLMNEHGLPDANGHVVVHYRDLTEQKMLQERLAQSDKLAALGKLAGGVAHEINSPLAGILAFSQMVLKEMDSEDPHFSDLREIEDAAKKCKVIVEGLLGFARQERVSDVCEVNLFEILESTLRLAAPLLRKNRIDLESNLPGRGIVIANSGKMGQVFLNLITNAIHAIGQSGGVISVEGETTDTEVLVTVRDTGVGIEPHHLKKIFDPFFTTKPIGEGTGLGLSVSYSIIKQYDGSIRVVSTPGLGSAFTVVLPRGS
jgi:two-component system NtrC family sensor kinase